MPSRFSGALIFIVCKIRKKTKVCEDLYIKRDKTLPGTGRGGPKTRETSDYHIL
jgi:hypothetical protein